MNTDFIIILQFLIISSAIIIVISLWKLFTKAHRPGWIALIPIYNIIVFLQIALQKKWWVCLLFLILFFSFLPIPIFGILAGFFLWMVGNLKFAQAFQKGTFFSLGMTFLPLIFYPLLAFNKNATYQGDQTSLNREISSPLISGPLQLQNKELASTRKKNLKFFIYLNLLSIFYAFFVLGYVCNSFPGYENEGTGPSTEVAQHIHLIYVVPAAIIYLIISVFLFIKGMPSKKVNLPIMMFFLYSWIYLSIFVFNGITAGWLLLFLGFPPIPIVLFTPSFIIGVELDKKDTKKAAQLVSQSASTFSPNSPM